MQRPIKGIQAGGDPSPDIHQLRQDIVSFLKAHPVGSENMGPPPAAQPAIVKLVKSKPANEVPPTVYNLQWATPPNNCAAAYCVGYQSISLQGHNVPFVDIPTIPGADLLFTGELVGCSLVVVGRSDGIRVYHDSRYCSSVLYDNVRMAVDHCDYAEEYSDPTRRKIAAATACMQYKNGSWTLYAQCLTENTEDARNLSPSQIPESKRVLRYRNNGCLITKTQYAGPNIAQERENLYQLLKRVAVEHLGEEKIPTTQDGQFTDFDPKGFPSMSNPAVARTEALRKAIVDHNLEGQIKQKVDLILEESKMHPRPADPNLDLHKKWERQDLAFHEFLKALSDSKSTDATFLWLKLKESQGLQAVIGP
ncbi:uncharacterized protein KD926_003521 [Aspergillus affinis]|uniref:uncharacterized protein n=1 Tax=Aspergillus affinis TaxID=1070780 RepID=UPI0022FDF84F|nr:uncharacterized protein KD926_003521 [Aspergillus affinis]KAI9035425.1 hypothetical protein KD926_003521 [Aspergillus affinis]